MHLSENPTTKERIFVEAVKLFAREGYKGATVRDICKAAGTANATALNYYYGGKANLYKAVLETIFSENIKRRKEMSEAKLPEDASPEERLRLFVDIMMEVSFDRGPLTDEFMTIFMREMISPSHHLDDIVRDYSRADANELRVFIAEILGGKAPGYVVRDCSASVAGQIFYYLMFWPLYSRLNPDHPGLAAYRKPLLEHIMRFSLAGLAEIKSAVEKGLYPPTPALPNPALPDTALIQKADS